MNEKSQSELKIIPLGGLGEIGLNMMVFEQGDDIIVVDCGLMFPNAMLPGVDYVIPDFSYLLENKDSIRGIVITHGHEDHIGALPFLLKQLQAPIYGTPLTLGLVHEKFIEHNLNNSTRLETINAGDTIELGSFEIEFIRVSHSIADCVALAIKTDAGNIIHTGDFKIDQTPIDGHKVDLASFARYGDLGVTALLSDSTNVERTGTTPSEREVGKALRDVFEDASGRLIMATFASNIHRIQQILNAAEYFGRKVAILGRSMVTNTRIASKLGCLIIPDKVVVEIETINKISKHKVVILTTGTQGEPLSGLSKMARDENKHIKITDGDTVVLSSRFIPGNERAIDYLINEFYKKGAEVVYEKVCAIHVSGHASQEELKLMLSLTRPRHFIPIHGEYRHLVRHSQLAMQMGVPREKVLVAEDGDVILFDQEGAQRLDKIKFGRHAVDGDSIVDHDDEIIQERRRLARDGILIAVAIMDLETGELLTPISLTSNGFLYDDESKAALEDARSHLEEQIMAQPKEIRMDKDALTQALRACLKKHFKKNHSRFPVIIPIIV